MTLSQVRKFPRLAPVGRRCGAAAGLGTARRVAFPAVGTREASTRARAGLGTARRVAFPAIGTHEASTRARAGLGTARRVAFPAIRTRKASTRVGTAEVRIPVVPIAVPRACFKIGSRSRSAEGFLSAGFRTPTRVARVRRIGRRGGEGWHNIRRASIATGNFPVVQGGLPILQQAPSPPTGTTQRLSGRPERSPECQPRAHPRSAPLR